MRSVRRPLTLTAALSMMVLSACSVAGQTPASRAPGVADGGSRTVAPSSVQPVLTADDDGLSLTVTPHGSVVEPGGQATFSVAVHNGRPTPVVLGAGCPVAMYGLVAVPQEPPGRTWEGVAGRFKRYVLEHVDGPGGHPALEPDRVYAVATDCDVESPERSLGPGETFATALTWAASITDGVPAAPGSIPFEVSLAHDPSGAPPSRAPGATGPMASWIRSVEQLVVHGSLDVVGESPGTVSAGQAVDALLADQRFQQWLSERPPSTWSQPNLFLVTRDAAEGIVPAGSSWEIDLFREHGVPREWAIAFVDAFSGELRGVTYCDAPCDR